MQSPAAIIRVTQQQAKKRQQQKQRLAEGLIWERSQVTKTFETEKKIHDALCAYFVTYERNSKHREDAARLHEVFKKLHDYRDAPGWTELHQKAFEETS
ncbi:hypothetical protein LQW54_011474 [Pestalotiopsis sp. IQ-011]